MTSPAIGVIVVTRDRADEIRACVHSILSQAADDVEVVVVLNGATPAVHREVEHLAQADARVRAVTITGRSASKARNVGVQASGSDVLYFLDDDVMLPPHGLAVLRRLVGAMPEVGVFGGPNLTPPDDPDFAQMTGALLASRWGSGIARPRYAARRAGEAHESDLILCNLAVRRQVFRDGVSFPELFGGEENALMGQAQHRGARMWYAPELWVHHRRRRTFRGFVQQVHRYGWGRANAIAFAPRTVRLAYFVPVAFAGYLLLLVPGTVVLGAPAWLPVAAYGLGSVTAAARICAAHRRPAWLVPLVALYPVTHLAYASGLAKQLLRLLLRRLRRTTRTPSTP
ncbi:MAG: glycosyltransferase [Myxococcota bacterium]